MLLYNLADWLVTCMDRKRRGIIHRLIGIPWVEKQIQTGRLTPNGITTFRLIIALMFNTLCVTGYWLTGGMEFIYRIPSSILFWPFLAAALSDALDGPTAEKFFSYFPNINHTLGINLDRHVDKIFTLPLLFFYGLLRGAITQIEISVLIGGDILATLLAMAAKKIGTPIPANSLGKAKMCLQCTALGWMILNLPELGLQYLLIAAITLGVASLAVNCTRFVQNFRASKLAVESAVHTG